MLDDSALLRRYAEEGSESAFAELVRRRLDLVYSVALRTTGGDAHRAQDAAQRVFTDLARKAAALARRPVLTGWLYRSARFAATDLVRAERRRQEREAAARTTHELIVNNEPDWHQLRPEIDAALADLNERDRDALLLRFFEELSFATVATRLDLSEDAARMRVERALEKVRVRLAHRGITSTAAALGGAIAGQAALAAPAGTATSIASSAVAATAAGAVTAFWPGIFAMSKIKIGMASALVVAGLGSVVVEVRANRALNAEFHSLRVANDHAVHLQQENRQLGASLAKQAAANPESAELVRLQQRLAQLRARPDGVTDAALHAPTNAGRATPEAAIETFCWAVNLCDLDTVAGMWAFSDDTPENRAAFMAALSPAIRARFGTPERVCAAACFPNVLSGAPDPAVAMQVTGVRQDGPDQVRLSLWIRTASGREIGGTDRYQRRPEGWGIASVALRDEKILQLARERLDPLTADPVYPRNGESK
jgi:RNA polymerase sigma factor (sigma-70 family)